MKFKTMLLVVAAMGATANVNANLSDKLDNHLAQSKTVKDIFAEKNKENGFFRRNWNRFKAAVRPNTTIKAKLKGLKTGEKLMLLGADAKNKAGAYINEKTTAAKNWVKAHPEKTVVIAAGSAVAAIAGTMGTITYSYRNLTDAQVEQLPRTTRLIVKAGRKFMAAISKAGNKAKAMVTRSAA